MTAERVGLQELTKHMENSEMMTSSISKQRSYAETAVRNKWKLPEWFWQPLLEGTERNYSFLHFSKFKYNKLFLDKS